MKAKRKKNIAGVMILSVLCKETDSTYFRAGEAIALDLRVIKVCE